MTRTIIYALAIVSVTGALAIGLAVSSNDDEDSALHAPTPVGTYLPELLPRDATEFAITYDWNAGASSPQENVLVWRQSGGITRMDAWQKGTVQPAAFAIGRTLNALVPSTVCSWTLAPGHTSAGISCSGGPTPELSMYDVLDLFADNTATARADDAGLSQTIAGRQARCYDAWHEPDLVIGEPFGARPSPTPPTARLVGEVCFDVTNGYLLRLVAVSGHADERHEITAVSVSDRAGALKGPERFGGEMPLDELDLPAALLIKPD